MTVDPLLKVENVSVDFPIRKGVVLQRHVGTISAVSDVSFEVPPVRR